MKNRLKILIIDGQGGRVGAQIIEGLKSGCPESEIICVGTNSVATASMLKAGADNGATGENAVIVNCRTADIIAGPIGIVIADSMLGEVTPAMAVAVGQSTAKKFLIPFNQCNNIVVGLSELPLKRTVQSAIDSISEAAENI